MRSRTIPRPMKPSRSLILAVPLIAALFEGACITPRPGAEAGAGGGDTGSPSSTNSASGGAGGGSEGGAGGSTDSCPAVVSFTPSDGMSALRVAGEWHGFDLASATQMVDGGNGSYRAELMLPPGLHAYKIVYDQNAETHWIFDPEQPRRKYYQDVENSGVLVRDCNLPWLEVTWSETTPSGFDATLSFIDAFDESGPEPTAFTATRRGPDGEQDVPIEVADNGEVSIALAALPEGKHTLTVTPATKSGRVGKPILLPFWIEAESFDWHDALIYMVVTDRFANGDPSNDPPATPNVDPRAEWMGGDFEGVRQAIANGMLDQLGVRAIWLTPFNTNPTSGYLAADNQHLVSGYHGYWPIKAREVDARLGGEAALDALVDEAHAHGIRVLMDYVVNHVHEDHEYMQQHPEWFRTGCVCGTDNCDWTSHALDCMFKDYMPDIDHRHAGANAQFVDDAMWWLERFDLDGLRIDAVKHVEELATRNLAAAVREHFEGAGTRYFLMGETAMGWNDCADPCNDENYGTIAKYVGPYGLDGQFDFVLYHGVSYRTFAYGDSGMLHADYWTQHGLGKWPAGAIMTPYIGSHDSSRFTTLADYRGQDGNHQRWVAGNQWYDTAVAPSDAEPYRRTRIAMSWLLMLPGAPLLYYGDEYGQWGGADPNNRSMWRDTGLSSDESATLSHVRKLGQARRDILALRRGDYVSLFASEDTLVFARTLSSSAAIVALTRLTSGDTATVNAASVGLPSGTVLQDAMGGPNRTVDQNGFVTIPLPASGAVILSP